MIPANLLESQIQKLHNVHAPEDVSKIICCEQNHATYKVLKALMKDKKFSKAHPL